ncbi:hypothetical protein LC612_36205 [Nostoc sp. CHAB 5834]|nr:hypothetical protein [Nostoc sp. CHAB 5834]
MPIDAKVIDKRDVTDLSPLLLDATGNLKVVDSRVLQGTSLTDRVAFGVVNGLYLLPTTELIAALKLAIEGRSAIEIGSGGGLLAQSLGIPATDNKMQDWPHIRALYESMGQKAVPYGKNVEELDAVAAVRKYRPQVVIASWVTHKYDPNRQQAGGNEYGVIEEDILGACETYIFIGNRKVHAHKSIWARPHTLIEPPWLYSRAFNGTPDFIAIWGQEQQRTKALIEAVPCLP